jgi:hypothetical protein
MRNAKVDAMHAIVRCLAAAVCAVLTVASVCAQQLPAVSGPNGKFSVEGGGSADDGEGVATGSFAMPLAPWLGLQTDGAVGSFDDEILGGGALHLFTRDPSSYLLGIYGSYHTWNSINIWRAALEGELYLGRITIEGLGGYESLDADELVDGPIVLTFDDNHIFGQADAAYYITDDFKVYAGYRYINETNFGAAGAEYLIRGFEVPLSLFARGDFGNEDFDSITGGLRVYLSDDPQRSLIDRHRRDDPKVYAPTFPTLAVRSTAVPQCSVSGSLVQSPSNGNCICPAGTPNAGQKPQLSGGGGYYCQNL